jgi:hypothetical protein
MHPQAGHQPIENQLQKRDQQDELDRVLEQERLIAQLSRDPFDGRS